MYKFFFSRSESPCVSATNHHSKPTASIENIPNKMKTPSGLRELSMSDSVVSDSNKMTSQRICVLTPSAMSEHVSVA